MKKNFLEGMDLHTKPHMMEQRLLYLRTEGFSPRDFFQNFTKSLQESSNFVLAILVPLLAKDGSNKTSDAVESLIKKTSSKLEHFNFLAHEDTLLPCPDGFKGEFFTYVETLNNHNAIVLSQALGALTDFNTYLASFIGDKASKIALKDNKRHYEELKKLREQQTKELESFFTSGTNQRQTLGKMFDNKTQIIESAKVAVNGWNFIKKTDPRDIQAQCQMIVKRLNLVIDECQSGKNTDVSKQAVVNLADGSYELGRQVEHLALYMARNEIASVTSGNILERLNTILR